MISTLRKTLFVAALAALIALSACSASSASSASGAPEADLFESQASSSSAFSATPAEASFSQSAEAVPESDSTSQTIQEEPLLAIAANGTTFLATFEDNSSAEAFAELLQDGPLTLSLHDYGNFEKVGPLGFGLPTNDEQITTEPGDVILYQGNQITVYYDTNTWNFTRLAHIDGATRESLIDAFGSADVDVTFSLEYVETD